MALRTAKSWTGWLSDLGFSKEEVGNYSSLLASEAITEEDLPQFDHDLLKACGVVKYGHRTKIMRKAVGPSSGSSPGHFSGNKAIAIPRPSIKKGATQLEFDHFIYEWNQFKKHYNFKDESVIETQLTFCCSKDIRGRIREGREPSETYNEEELIGIIKDIALSRVSRMTHIKNFSLLKQEESESCEDYYGRLQTMASCCKFQCEYCSKSNATSRIRERFILGLKDKYVQAAILRTETHKPETTFNKLLEEAITLEQSVREQKSIAKSESVPAEEVHDLGTDEESDEPSANSLNYKFNKRKDQGQQSRNNFPLCSKCGTKTHSIYTTSERCIAWGKNCKNCGGRNHFAKVCQQSDERSSKTQQKNNGNNVKKHNRKKFVHQAENYVPSCFSIEKSAPKFLTVDVESCMEGTTSRTTEISAFPDTGANVCLIGPKQLKDMGISRKRLNKCELSIRVAGGSSITATGSLTVWVTLGKRKSKSLVYFSLKSDRFYMSLQVCKDLGIVPSSFPYPPDFEEDKNICSVEHQRVPPKHPHHIPFEFTEENIPKLKQFLLDSFATSAFNRSKPFPKLSTPKARIHLKPNYVIPVPAYWPATVAEHWAEEVRKSIEDDVAAGILCRVPFNEPTIWCARMVIVGKKNGKPRRTVDYQQLNAQCLREPNHGSSPFHTARKVPQNKWKSVIDAVDGYHSVELDEESSKLTTFITPWGRFRYLRFPQGHCSAGDAFNGRVQHILSSIPRMVRIVDDVCIYDDSIEQAFWHAWDVLITCAQNGIVINQEKFQFCAKEVEFAGLAITSSGVQPSKDMIAAIDNFPPPSDITKARAFFGLTNQVNWAYANSPDMAPFRELVRPGTKFQWTDDLKSLFAKCKKKILQQVQDGVVKYDIKRYTCLQTDFSKDGLGYLLLQKYCDCSLDKAPLCCVDGWKLVFAGSRFTKGAEVRYAPTEGEALAIAWAINHAHIFTKGCQKLIISTDHKPLLGIFNSKPLEEIKNPRLVRLKEQMLGFTFTLKYNCGKWHRGPDALSRNPHVKLVDVIPPMDSNIEDEEGFIHEAYVLAITALEDDVSSLPIDQLRRATLADKDMQLLASTIEKGFPPTHQFTKPEIRQFFNVRHDLWIEKDIIMFKNRVVIPPSLRKKILSILHSAHQGVQGMRSRAANSVFWPGLNSSIREKRESCEVCERIAPSHPKEPLQLIPQATYPFQEICADAFEVKGRYYLAVVDRFTSWLLIFHFNGPPQAKHIIACLRSVFVAYGAPEKFFSDGGLPFQAKDVADFFRIWAVVHITSSAHYPQANGRAELAVKTSKRLMEENTASDGSLNCDKASQALLQYRNTPLQHLGLSPAQMLFHRNLRDGIPVQPESLKLHREWLDAALLREKAFEKRNATMTIQYNRDAHPLEVIPVGSKVLVQDVSNRKRWTKSGTVVEQADRSYTIRMHGSGRIITRNRKHIKIARVPTSDDEENASAIAYSPAPASTPDIVENPTPVVDSVATVKTPRMLRRLRSYNNSGLNE